MVLLGMSAIICLAFIMAPILFGTAALIGAVVIYREVRNEAQNEVQIEEVNDHGTND